MRPLTVHRSDATLEGFLSKPAFELLGPNGYELHSRFYKAFAKFGLKADDIETHRGQSKLSDQRVSYYLPIVDTSINVTLEKIEIVFGLERLNREQIDDIASQTIINVGEQVGIDFNAFQATMALHGVVEGSKSLDEVRGYIKIPSLEDNLINHAAILMRFSEKDKSPTQFLLEPSAIINNGIFLRTTAIANIDDLKEQSIYKYFRNRLDRTIEHLNLYIKEDKL